MEEIEKEAILRTLQQTGGNRTRAADLLGIGLRTLQRKLREYEQGTGEGQGAGEAQRVFSGDHFAADLRFADALQQVANNRTAR